MRSSFLQSSTPRVTLTSGTKLGEYEVKSLLGSGGMGEVYRARDSRLGRDVAIKVLPSSLSADSDRLRRFEQEARAAAALNHPNILAVHQMGTYEGAPYLVSELLEGETLREQIKRGRLSVRKAIDYGVQIARGLAAAHEKGIVHRDLKPENLFVTKDGRLKILDFGLAKLTQPQSSSEQGTDADRGDGSGSGDGHGGLHVAGAGAGTNSRPSRRHFCLRRDPVRNAGGEAGVSETDFAGDDDGDSERRPAEHFAGHCKHSARPAAGSASLSGEKSGAAISVGVRLGVRVGCAIGVRRLIILGKGYECCDWRWETLEDNCSCGRGCAGVVSRGLLLFPPHDQSSPTRHDCSRRFCQQHRRCNLRRHVEDGAHRFPAAIAFPECAFRQPVAKTLATDDPSGQHETYSEVARELCQRAGSKAYIAGSIGSLGSEYVVGLKAVNCQSGDTLAQEQVTAASKEKVLDTLGEAASKLRGELGESLATVQKFDVPLAQATTSSLEALKAYSLGLKAYNEKGMAAALPYYQRAIELDPNFAMAYIAVGDIYDSLGEAGRASEYYTKAFQLREHASEREKLTIIADYYETVTGEFPCVSVLGIAAPGGFGHVIIPQAPVWRARNAALDAFLRQTTQDIQRVSRPEIAGSRAKCPCCLPCPIPRYRHLSRQKCTSLVGAIGAHRPD